MRPKRLLLLSSLTLTLVLGGLVARPIGSPRVDLPASLTDQEFWRLTEEMSEPNGAFTSDNLMSNERVFARLVPELVAKTKPGGVYLGVGPEQNFTYIAAMRPRMAFITDIRRGNLHLQLMYKALFELSADRAEFVSRLFTKPRPAGLTATSTVTELMNAYWDASTADEKAYAANLQAIHTHLTNTRALPLSAEDLDGIAAVYRAFYWYGPAITWSARISLPPGSTGSLPMNVTVNGNPGTVMLAGSTYWDMVTQSDASGQGLTWLASEETFNFMKDLERKNLIVPVVGNFSGPKALRAVGAYVRDRGATVSAFYLSNVESYLSRAGTWTDFCSNVAAMPLDEASQFIRPNGAGNPANIGTRQVLTFATISRDPVTGAVTLVQHPAPAITPIPGVPMPPVAATVTPTPTPTSASTSTPTTATPSIAPSKLTGLVPMAAEVRACAK